ncbi:MULTISPECIES: hypothetical protein [Shewanella]|nr:MULTISPECIES: hypothetical protein [Shewanella]
MNDFMFDSGFDSAIVLGAEFAGCEPLNKPKIVFAGCLIVEF